MSFALRAIAAQPQDYALAVSEDVALTFLDTDHSLIFAGRMLAPTTVNFNYQVTALREYLGHGTPLTSVKGTPVHQPYAYVIHGYQSRLYFPGLLFALVLAGGFIGILMPRRRSGAAMLLWASAAVMIILPSAEHTFNYRYALPAVPLACMAPADPSGCSLADRGRDPRSRA
jgi:lipopolysaccharide export LptBFGC system permease protein LptF